MSKKPTEGALETIDVYGAREHNLKDINLQIPRNKLIVFTGLSGSGKSSLAFDTIFAEGQRRYIDTFSSYVKQFIGGLERPDVDKIDGLSPVISIEQKTVSRSPRSTVGTITELYDFFRLLFARVGTAYSYVTNEPMVKYSDEAICQRIEKDFKGKKVAFLAPKIKGRKGHYRELFEQILRNGYTKVRVDGEIKEIVKGMKLDRYKIHDIEVVVDRMLIGQVDEKRIYDSVLVAMKMGESAMMVMDLESETIKHYSPSLMCPTSGISYPEPEPSLFSFNSPYGACPSCKGLGEVSEIDTDKIIPNPSLSIRKGGFAPLGEYKRIWIFEKMEAILIKQGYSINTPIADLDEELIQLFLYGNEDMEMNAKSQEDRFEGIANFMTRHSEDSTAGIQRWAQGFMNKKVCSECHGARVRKEALQFKINSQTIGDLAFMDFAQLNDWTEHIEAHLSTDQLQIGAEILKEIRTRIRFILEVGLDYLTLHLSLIHI
jgi:excinuclease ABC subunit A